MLLLHAMFMMGRSDRAAPASGGQRQGEGKGEKENEAVTDHCPSEWDRRVLGWPSLLGFFRQTRMNFLANPNIIPDPGERK